jgi:hypothetical protein
VLGKPASLKIKIIIFSLVCNSLSQAYKLIGEYPCVATGTYNNIITYIQNVSYIDINNIS